MPGDRRTIPVFGYFLWERGLRGPQPVVIRDRHQYLSEKTWKARTIGELHALTEAQSRMSLAELAILFPCPEKPDGSQVS